VLALPNGSLGPELYEFGLKTRLPLTLAYRKPATYEVPPLITPSQ
jgi:hypothetical protein